MGHARGWSALVASIVAGVGCNDASAAEAKAALCKEARPILQGADSELAAATKAALAVGNAQQDNQCLYPAKLMRYGSVDVLVTVGATPGNACHGCAATMSAYVFRRRPEGLALVSRFVGFGEAGTNGDPGKIEQLPIAGSDGFAVAHGGTFQGYSSTRLDLYVFKGGKLVHVKPSLELSADDSGAKTDESKVTSVDGSWSLGAGAPNEVAIDYKVKKYGRSSTSRATWRIDGPALSPKSGHVPPEYAEASGGG